MRKLAVLSLIVAPTYCAALEMLDESELSNVTGQAGITVEIDAMVNIGELSYVDDGNPLSLEGVKIHNSRDPSLRAQSLVNIDVDSNGELVLHHFVDETRLQVDEIKVNAAATGSDSFGRIALDFDMESYLRFVGGGRYNADQGMSVSTYNTRIFGVERDGDGNLILDASGNPVYKGAEFFYRDDGNDLMVSFDYEHWGTDWSLDVVSDPFKPGQDALLITYPDHNFNLTIDEIKFKTRDAANNDFNGNPNNSGLSGQSSVGMITASGHIDGELYISAGGKDPEQGLTFNYNQTLTSGDLRYVDTKSTGEQYEVALVGITHDTQVSNLTFDVLNDGLWIATERAQGSLSVSDVYLGTDYSLVDSAKTSMGSLQFDYLFEDQTVGSTTYTNELRLSPKGNQYGGSKGITVASQWSLSNADIGYTDDGNTVWISGIKSYGAGNITLDLIDASFIYANRAVPGSEDPFFDGVRIGFDDVVGHYSIDGMRVGPDKNSADLQGGTELLLPLHVFQEADFTLNGHMTVLPGGSDGDGLTINSDLHFTDTTFGITVDQDRSGLWLDDVTYDISMRDGTLDVDERGVVLNRGLYVSNMNVGNVRFGDKTSGDSLGQVVISRLEKDSEMYLRSGGAGAICVGGTAGNEAGCLADGGRWEDRGDQGVTIGITSHFVNKGSLSAEDQALVNAIDPDAETKLGWYRQDGKVGIEAVGISTGPDGLTVELGVDVADTVVRDRATGVESVRTGFAVDTSVQFSRLSIDRINMNHHVGGSQPIFYGAQFENVNLRANITATPIQ